MTEPHDLSIGTNVLAEDWRPQVEAAWDCPLSSAQVSSVEVFCSLTVRHLRVDADLRERADALGTLSPRVIADGEKRHKKMARLARNLREMVVADLSGQHKGYRLSFKTFPNSPLGGLEWLIGLITFLERLEEEAKLPAPDQLLWLAGVKKGRKRGRPEGSDPWTELILFTMSIYTRARGKPPTSHYSKHKQRYDSPFLRGLDVIHGALPRDVRKASTTFLGSRVARILSKQDSNSPTRGVKSRRASG
jgi:hypothetical protein